MSEKKTIDFRSQEQTAQFDRMSAECDERNRIWKLAHLNDPCESCHTQEGIDFYPTGSSARLTPLCKSCATRMQELTANWHAGWNAGYGAGQDAFRRRPWWARLWSRS